MNADFQLDLAAKVNALPLSEDDKKRVVDIVFLAMEQVAQPRANGMTAAPASKYPTVKIEDGELVEYDADQPDGEFYLVPIADGVSAPNHQTFLQETPSNSQDAP